MTAAPLPKPTAADRIDQDKRDIKRGSTLSILGFLARLCARVPFLFIAGRLYGTASYGEYVLLTAIVETTALLSTFGLKRTIFRFIDEKNSEQGDGFVIRHSLILCVCLSLVLVAIIQTLATPILQIFSVVEIRPDLIILSWAIPFISLTDIFLSATLSRRIMRYEIAVRSFVEPIALTLFSLGLYLLGVKGSGLVFAFLFAFTIAAVVSAYACNRVFGWRDVLIGPVRASLLLEMAQKSLTTCLHDLARVLVTRLDTFAVGYFFSTSVVGLYGMAQQFLTIVEKVAASFYPMLMPVVSAAVGARDRGRLLQQLRAAGVRLVLLQFPVILIFYFFGKSLLGLIGTEFSAAWPVLMILSLGCWANSVVQLVEIPLTYMRPYVNVVGSLIAISAYIVFVTGMQERFGLNGIALTSVTAALFANSLLLVVFTRTPLNPKADENSASPSA